MGGVFPGLDGMSADLIEDGVRLSENRLVRKAQDDEPLGAKPVVSRLILGFPQHMDAAIGLQHELVGRTAAVGDIGADGHLTTEAQGVDLSVADQGPQRLLGGGRRLSLATRRRVGAVVVDDHVGG